MKMNKIYRPVIAITMGDPAGIGPEIAAKVFASQELYQICNPLLIGNKYIMRNAIKTTGVKLQSRIVGNISEARYEKRIADILEISVDGVEQIKSGIKSASAGDMAFKAIKLAIDLALERKADATVTGPIHKKSLNMAGHHFSGHTEIFAHFTRTSNYAMLLIDDALKVMHVTTHVSLRQACDMIKKKKVLDVIILLNNELKKIGIVTPRIGVAGLNPHAGDDGLFGDEEINEIVPAVTEAKNSGILADGPLPADSLYTLACGGKFDGCVAMYHDQGHIPFKLLGFEYDRKSKSMKSVRGVNITVGLPIIRTSVDHGTAFDIAGKGIASPDALMQAVVYAAKLAGYKRTEGHRDL